MTKDELVETIQVKHRQLERYLFYFEKNSDGVFVASDRPKFGTEEMLQPGAFSDWSLKDLLSHIIDWERRFLLWYHAGLEDQTPSELPSPLLRWDRIDTSDFPIPMGLRARPIKQLLNEFKDSYRRVVSTIASIPEESLVTSGYYSWTGDASLADFVALCTFRHYDWAKGLVRRWRKSHPGEYLNKQIVIERIQTEHRRLVQNLEVLSDEQMETTDVVGEWTIKDLLAHLSDWEQRFIGWYEAGVRGHVPEVPAPGISWENLDVLNQRIYEKNRDRSLKDVREEFNLSYKQAMATIKGISEEDMFAVGQYAWLGEGNLVIYILANTANHYRWAKQAVRNCVEFLGES
ncbi:MAG: ClbS/DfsB family four-helix bundle protein [Anaerolineales bacterium]